MDERTLNRLLFSVRSHISSAQEELTILQRLNATYQSRLSELNAYRRQLLFSTSEDDTIPTMVTLVNDLEVLRNRLDASKNHLSALLSAALSYIVMIAENSQETKTTSMIRARNGVRAITRIVESSKGLNVNYSALVAGAAQGAVIMGIKEDGEVTRRLFVALKDAVL